MSKRYRFMGDVPRLNLVVPGLALIGTILVVMRAEGTLQPFRGARFGPDSRIDGGTGNAPGTAQVEPAVTVDPQNPTHLVAAYMGGSNNIIQSSLCHTAVSSDGGATWVAAGGPPLERNTDRCFDVSLGISLGGTVYYSYMLNTKAGSGGSVNDIAVARSNDGGRTFPSFSVVAAGSSSILNDKPYLAVDSWPRSPFTGSVYVAYAEFVQFGRGGSNVKVASSRDGMTWSAPVSAFSLPLVSGTVEGCIPAVGPDGTVYVFFAQFNTQDNGLSIRFAKSGDGGVTWGPIADVATGLPSAGIFLLRNADAKFGSSDSAGIRGNSLPAVAATPDGKLHVVWTDFPSGTCIDFPSGSNGPACSNADVRLSTSRDGGRSWSPPVKVSDDTGSSDQFLPWIAAHPDGLVSIVWLDRRNDPSNVMYDVYYTNTYDDATFLPNLKLTSMPSNPGTTTFIGDYSGLAGAPTSVVAAWADLRFSNLAVFTARGDLSP